MKKIIIINLIIVLFSVSCSKDRFGIKGEGPTISEIRTNSTFEGIRLNVSATVEIKRDSVFKVEVFAQKNVLSVLETKVIGNKLQIGTKNHTFLRKHEPIIIKISMPSVNHLEVSGSGKITCLDPIFTNNLDIKISGSGKIHFSGQIYQKMSSDISGSGSVYLYSDGICQNSNINISGSGQVNAQNFKSEYSQIEISGSGSIKQEVLKELNGSISGSGTVEYWNNPIVNVSISGSGKVKRMNF